MKIPLQVTFRGFPHSDAVEANVRDKADKLDQFFSDIMSCRVVVEAQHKHHQHGNLYHVSIDLSVPGRELAVTRDPSEHQAHEDVYVAIRDAFDAARRQLEDYARELRGDVKTHEPPERGHIVELVPAEDFGRIATPNGRLVYFHRNSVLDADFDQLREGDEVTFAEEDGELGPQASTVRVTRRH
ncbi:MAG: HPF/RaiA family ribosome-associated protein [Thiocapsa sp.]|jgi:ribosome-associated translation inhibitor RaiA/cold shock CspA family protein|nr:HPF/RaiA family ribosome-associated protein [Thiocapsa sp.]MCG6985177.1 HPF/RaiA family ribosome-associated protein [Thiocapsa sp.]